MFITISFGQTCLLNFDLEELVYFDKLFTKYEMQDCECDVSVSEVKLTSSNLL